jgi:large subunit ribosomal protein L22
VTGPKTNEREGTRAVLRHARVSPNKVREVLDLVRNRPVHEAEDILRFSERDAAFTVGKLLRSAVANAEHNDGLDPEELFVAACFADEGATIKRWRPRARGRATRIRKRTTHITVIVSRMPQAQLDRLRARRQAEQLAQRARRVAGARANEGDTRSRSERRRRGAGEHDHEGHDHEHDHDDEAVETDEAIETDAEDVETDEAVETDAEDVEAEAEEVEAQAEDVEAQADDVEAEAQDVEAEVGEAEVGEAEASETGEPVDEEAAGDAAAEQAEPAADAAATPEKDS